MIKRTVWFCVSCFVLKGFVVTKEDPVKNDLKLLNKRNKESMGQRPISLICVSSDIRPRDTLTTLFTARRLFTLKYIKSHHILYASIYPHSKYWRHWGCNSKLNRQAPLPIEFTSEWRDKQNIIYFLSSSLPQVPPGWSITKMSNPLILSLFSLLHTLLLLSFLFMIPSLNSTDKHYNYSVAHRLNSLIVFLAW